MAARCFVASGAAAVAGRGHRAGAADATAAIALSAGYVVAALLARGLRRFKPIRGFGAAWLSTIGVDLVTFTALQVLQVGSINYTPLFALPVLMGAVLGTSAVGLGTTAVATLLLLAHATWYWLEQPADTSPVSSRRR